MIWPHAWACIFAGDSGEVFGAGQQSSVERRQLQTTGQTSHLGAMILLFVVLHVLMHTYLFLWVKAL